MELSQALFSEWPHIEPRKLLLLLNYLYYLKSTFMKDFKK